MKELIEKLSSAQFGSADLDHLILAAIHERPEYEAESNFGGYKLLPSFQQFTRKIDAAIRLVPNGYYWVLGTGRGYHVEVRPMAYIAKEPTWIGDYFGYHGVQAATHSLAMCIAALTVINGDRLA